MGKNKGKILVTGGGGFIGSNLVRKLYKLGYQVTIFDLNTSHIFLKGLKIKLIKGDIRDYDSVLKAVKGNDFVYHLASYNVGRVSEKKKILGINEGGTGNVMRACLESKVKKVVHVSSGSVLGFTRSEKKKLDENNILDFKDQLYGQSKKFGEDQVQKYITKGLKATIVLPCYVIGAGETDPSRYGVYKSISKGRIKFTYPGGTSTVAVEDLVNGMVLAMEKGKVGERYNLCSAFGKLFDFYNMIAILLKKPKIRIEIPRFTYFPMYFLAAILQTIMKNPPIATETVRWFFNFRYYDSTKAKRELGWKPKIPLEESIRRAIIYYRKIGALK